MSTDTLRRGQLAPIDVWTFMFAGKALFTLYNPKTDRHITYKIKLVDNSKYAPAYFVSVLVGPNNTNDYAYVGMVSVGGVASGNAKLKLTKASKFSYDSIQVKAFEWLLLRASINELGSVKVYHEGKCARCGRALTTPGSCKRGIGPECAKNM